MSESIIAVTMGDPAGIGPEICAKAADAVIGRNDLRLMIVGDLALIKQAASVCGVQVDFRPVDSPAAIGPHQVGVMDPRGGRVIDFAPGLASPGGGQASLDWIRCVDDLGRRKQVDGIVFGPVNSQSLKLTGAISEIDELQPAGTFMLRVNGSLRVMPITEHVRIREVAETVTTKAVEEAAQALDQALRRWGFLQPRIGVAGLNPHAMFEEDLEQIRPAVEQLISGGLSVAGPISPDTVFWRAMQGEFDAVLTMFHDQGQIALKTARFSGGCTIYIGLDHVQISIPHGTAFDIAGSGKADASGMTNGILMAASLASGGGFK